MTDQSRRLVVLDDDDHVSVRLIQRRDGRQWAKCSCGWVSPDIVGAEGAAEEWSRHLRLVASRSSQPVSDSVVALGVEDSQPKETRNAQ